MSPASMPESGAASASMCHRNPGIIATIKKITCQTKKPGSFSKLKAHRPLACSYRVRGVSEAVAYKYPFSLFDGRLRTSTLVWFWSGRYLAGYEKSYFH